jgi:hypothetical protein
LKLPNDIRQWLQRRYDGQHCAWLAEPLASGSWPLTIPLGLPTEAQALRQAEAVRAWVDTWRSWKGIGEVSWVERQWQVLGAQRLPVSFSVSSPAQLAAAIGQGERWSLATERHAYLCARWPGFKVSQRVFEVLAAYPTADFERLVTFVEWVLAHPASGLLPRQLPIAGIDSKWLETRKGIIADLVTGRRGESSPGEFFQLCGLSRPPVLVRLRVLDPHMRSLLGGLGDFAAPVAELAQLPVRPEVVFIVENLQSGLALPDLPGAVAFMALGYGVDMLRTIPWIAAGQCVFWGDIDTHGFSILARGRRLFPGAISMLMDEETLLSHAHLWGSEPIQDTAADQELLSAEELKTYLGLRQNQWGQQVRLEQERLAWDGVLQALNRYLKPTPS